MSKNQQSLLLRLGDDWHNPRPFLDYIESILSSPPNLQEIQRQLLLLYEDEFYNFKSLKYQSIETLYDVEINNCEAKKNKIEEQSKKEDKTFKSACEKFEALSAVDKEGEEEKEGEEDEEEEKEEDYQEEYTPTKSVEKDTKIQAKQSKESIHEEKQKKLREAQMIKNLKSIMATSQDKLMSFQKEIDELEIKIKYYGFYRDAEVWFLGMKRKLILEYSKDKDLKAFVKGIDDAISYRNTMRKRYVPTDPCSGVPKGLCRTHYLPLSVTKFSEKGDPIAVKCSL